MQKQVNANEGDNNIQPQNKPKNKMKTYLIAVVFAVILGALLGQFLSGGKSQVEFDEGYSKQCGDTMKRLSIFYNIKHEPGEYDKQIGEHIIKTVQVCETANKWWGALRDNEGALGLTDAHEVQADFWISTACLSAENDRKGEKFPVCEDYKNNHSQDGEYHLKPERK